MPEPQTQSHAILQLICFKLGCEEFGVDILKVREIVPMQYIAHLPQTPESVAGIINLRGNLIPVIHLRKKFGLDDIEIDDKTRIIVFAIAGKLIGMIVDRVERVFRMREDQFEPPPDLGIGKIQDYVIGMGKSEQSLVILIDIEKILSDEEMIQLEDIRKMKQAYKAVETKKQAGNDQVQSSTAPGTNSAGPSQKDRSKLKKASKPTTGKRAAGSKSISKPKK